MRLNLPIILALALAAQTSSASAPKKSTKQSAKKCPCVGLYDYRCRQQNPICAELQPGPEAEKTTDDKQVEQMKRKVEEGRRTVRAMEEGSRWDARRLWLRNKVIGYSVTWGLGVIGSAVFFGLVAEPDDIGLIAGGSICAGMASLGMAGTVVSATLLQDHKRHRMRLALSVGAGGISLRW